MKIKHVKQTKHNNCGQTCIQMLCNLDDTTQFEEVMGKRGLTTARDLATFIRLYPNFSQTKKKSIMVTNNQAWPAIAVLKLSWHSAYRYSRASHWVLLVDGIIHDPALDNSMTLGKYLEFVNKKNQEAENNIDDNGWIVAQDFRITSYIQVQQ